MSIKQSTERKRLERPVRIRRFTLKEEKSYGLVDHIFLAQFDLQLISMNIFCLRLWLSPEETLKVTMPLCRTIGFDLAVKITSSRLLGEITAKAYSAYRAAGGILEGRLP